MDYIYKSNKTLQKIKLRKYILVAIGLLLIIATILSIVMVMHKKNTAQNINNKNPQILGSITSQIPENDSPSVCLDAGHGGIDQGGNEKNIIEKDIDLIVAKEVSSLLKLKGYNVFMTRTNDESLSKQDRYDYCNNKKADILVSIHHNSYTTPDVDYSMALFYKKSDQTLASSIVNAVSSKLKITNNGIASLDTRLLSMANMPATISEGFFMSNYEEYNLLAKSSSVRLFDEAQGIANGIINYFENPNLEQAVINGDPLIPESND